VRLADLTNSDRKIPAPERFFLVVVLLVSGTVTLPQVADVGFVTGLGLWTMGILAAAWGLWAVRPALPRAVAPVLLPLFAFTLFCCCSPAWGQRNGTTWVQLLTVIVAVPGLILLTARECGRVAGFREAVLAAADFASVTAALAYTLTLLAFGPGGDAEVGGRPLFLARPFALFALVAVARQLARWHAGRPAGLVNAVWVLGLVLMSQSRLGLVTILVLFPLSYALVGGRRNLTMAAVMLMTGGLGLTLLLMFSQTMYDRFFGFDASLQVGGVSINAMGRTAAWEALLGNIRGWQELWFGHGSGAASDFCSTRFANLPHPHNDYIRFLYDFGVVGLGWFLLFVLACLTTLGKRMRAADRAGEEPGARAEAAAHRGALLALVAVLASMATDNSANYVFVMAPLAILLGAALSAPARGVHRPAAIYADGLDWVFADAPDGGHRPDAPAAATPDAPGTPVAAAAGDRAAASSVPQEAR
jgi:hypothetical protein